MPVAPSISVVVPTHQRRQRVLALLQAFYHQTLPLPFEVIVSIDGSTDGTREAVEATRVPYALRVISQPNRGRAAAVNAGMSASSGDLLVLLDDDMEPVPEFLEAHWKAHEGRVRLGVMGAAPVLIDPGASPATRYVGRKFNGHLRNLERAGYVLLLTDFYSGNFSIRRADLQGVGGFDEDFRLYGNEDLELSLRLERAGVSLVYSAAARATQHNDKDFAALTRDSIAEGRTAVLFAVKHPDAFDRLKLGSHAKGPLFLRIVRDGLLRVSGGWTGFPDRIIWLERLLARVSPFDLTTFYRFALGFFFWIGVKAALRDLDASGGLNEPLARLAKVLRP